MDEIISIIKKEEERQKETINLIPSENYPSKYVLTVEGSYLISKYAEGYPGRRYYQGTTLIDQTESLAIKRAKKLFGVPYANVQPYSGSIANAAILFALCSPGDKIAGLKLSSGGHLTHGHPKITFSGKYFKSVQYEVDKKGRLDYERVEKLLKKEKPKVIFAGTTAYPFEIDFEKFGKIADAVDAYLVADISHISGLVVAGLHPNPVSHAHLLMTTTHKMLRGPRGAILMVTDKGIKFDPELPDKLDRAIFPGLQGGPHENTIGGIAVCLNEALNTTYRGYCEQIIKNAKVLKEELVKKGIRVWGTENHLMVLDLSEFLGGYQMAKALEVTGIIVNKNTLYFEKGNPLYPSGIRIGTPAVTTRGMKELEMKKIVGWIFKVYQLVKNWKMPVKKEERKSFLEKFEKWLKNNNELIEIKREVNSFAKKFPLRI